MLYGKIRPKLFTSEPSAVTFGFTLFAFCWYVLSEWRWKLVGYGMLFTAAFLLMRGPTLILGLTLLFPSETSLPPRAGRPRVSPTNRDGGPLAMGPPGCWPSSPFPLGSHFYTSPLRESR